eukprot:707164-Prymnesium_polylepis.1
MDERLASLVAADTIVARCDENGEPTDTGLHESQVARFAILLGGLQLVACPTDGMEERRICEARYGV